MRRSRKSTHSFSLLRTLSPHFGCKDTSFFQIHKLLSYFSVSRGFFVRRGRTQTVFLCTELKPDKRQQIITPFFIFVIEHTKLLNLSLVQIVRLFREQNRAFSQAGCLSEEKNKDFGSQRRHRFAKRRRSSLKKPKIYRNKSAIYRNKTPSFLNEMAFWFCQTRHLFYKRLKHTQLPNTQILA